MSQSVTKSMSYHLRVDGNYDEAELKRFDDHFIRDFNITVIFAYHELADKTLKPHFHAHLECDQFKDEKALRAARKRIKEFFGKEGSKVSFSKDKGMSMIYTVKQQHRIYYRGITEDELKVYESKSYTKDQVKTKGKKEDAPMLVMYKKFEQHVDEDIDKLSKGKLKPVDIKDIVDRRYVTRFVVRYYHSIAHKSFGIGRMAEAVNFIYLKYLWDKCHISNNDETWVDPDRDYISEENKIIELVDSFYLRT